MSLPITSIEEEAPRTDFPSRGCEECGYDLTGLGQLHPCPECGHVSRKSLDGDAINRAWMRRIEVGLALLLGVTLDGLSTVLIMPFGDGVGGSLPSLNVPGPKVWAVPLLQRAIGNKPEMPGVIGTRAVLLGMLAIWLITSPRPGQDEDQWLRRLLRWGAVVLVGGAFGFMLATEGLRIGELPPYKLLLIVGVDLPATTLLYAYLVQLSHCVPGLQRRRILEALRWAIPVVMTLCAGMIAVAYLRRHEHGEAQLLYFPIFAGVGIAAAICGLTAGGAVAGLLIAFAGAAFPGVWQLLGGARPLAVRLWRWTSGRDSESLRLAAVALGLLLFVLTALLGNDAVLWSTVRWKVAGNLPFANYFGPKLWAVG